MTATELIAREQATERGRQREVVFPFAQERDDAPSGDGLTLEGYAAVFNTPAHIEDFDGQYDEVIAPGAFKRTLNARTPVLMFNHGRHPLIGPMPLGAFEELREDPRGLYVRARLFNNYLVWPVRDAIAAGAIDGMSFRFEIEKQSWSRSGGTKVRTVHAARVPELGPVVFPAYADAKVIVRSLDSYLDTGNWQPGYVDLADLGETDDEHERTECDHSALDTKFCPECGTSNDVTRDDEHDDAHERADDTGTSEEPADTGTSEEPAAPDDDPADTGHSESHRSTPAERKHFARQIEAARMGARKDT